MQKILHHINGQLTAGSSSRLFDVYDPARGVVTKQVVIADATDVESAIAAATNAFTAWRDMSWANRQQILFKFRELLNARKPELAAIITEEHGKVLSDALGEVTRGQEVVEFALGAPHLAKGEHSEQVSTGVDVFSLRQDRKSTRLNSSHYAFN